MLNFDQSLPMILHRTLDGVMPEFRNLFAKYNLTEQQWRILRILWEDEKVTSADLSARSLLPPPSLVGIIDRLENKQLVTRLRSLEDRRIVYVLATAKGRRLGDEVVPMVQEINNRIRQTLSQEEWRMMETALSKITDGMKGGTRRKAESA